MKYCCLKNCYDQKQRRILGIVMKLERIKFIDYLRHTLIPDLRESGQEATAEDFAAALYYIEHSDCNITCHLQVMKEFYND